MLSLGKMTSEKPGDDKMFINSTSLQTGRYGGHDRSRFFRIGSIAGSSHAEYSAIEIEAGFIF
jgi:hypothetical protein